MLKYIKRKLGNFKVYMLYYFYKIIYLKPLNFSFFDGKSVAIVGPADSALEKKNGYYIDSFDVVIRINKGIDIADKYPEYLGSKTDILVHGLNESICGNIDTANWKKKGVKFVVYPENEPNNINISQVCNFSLKNEAKFKLFRPSREEYLILKSKLNNSNPNSGFSAIYYVLNSKPKSVFITGFTFYKTPYITDYSNEGNNEIIIDKIIKDGYHNPNNDFKLFKEMLKESSLRIEFDYQLNMILDNEMI